MLTRCPTCQTTFRITPEQLQARSGRVRCGQCQHIFDAREHLEADPSDETILAAPLEPAEAAPPEAPAAGLPEIAPAAHPADLPLDAPTRLPADLEPQPAPQPLTLDAPEPLIEAEPLLDPAWDPAGETLLAPGPDWDPAGETVLVPRPDMAPEEAKPVADGAIAADGRAVPPAVPPGEPGAEPGPADAEPQSTHQPDPNAEPVVEGAAPAVALLNPVLTPDPSDPILARDHTEIPGYSKWAQAPLAGGAVGLGGAQQRPAWPYVLAATLLVLALLGQAAAYWRTELCTSVPGLRGVFAALGVKVPLPRVTEKISLEASDLQSDASRGLLVLQATLRNRAAFAQAYPSLDLALTDVGDTVVLRRTLAPADYLPAGAPAEFAQGADLAVKVWLDIKPLEAAGYRLVVFYP